MGAGGFLGAAWMLGALSAVQEHTAWDIRDAELMVGTSAGSVLAALLRAGVSVGQLRDAHALEASTAAATTLPDTTGPAIPGGFTTEPCWPGLPQLGLGSLPLVVQAARSPMRLTPSTVCTAFLPKGRRSLASVGTLVKGVHPGRRWPRGTWVVAMNYHTGARVTFGRTGSARTALARAVMASCAVPAWYAPVPIHRIPHVDGGVCSPCNADLLAPAGLDEVYVLAPMASLELDRPRTPLALLERLWRRIATKRVLREAARLRASGARVTLLTPNAADLEVMGANMMDGARRGEVLESARNSVQLQLAAADGRTGIQSAA